MDGATVVYGVLSAHAGLAALVGTRIYTDDAFTPEGLPAVQIETVSSNDRNTLAHGAKVHVRQRIRIRSHSNSATDRAAVRAELRKAIYAARLTASATGLSQVVVEMDSEGPDGLAMESDVRIGLIDVIVTYNEDR